MNPILGVAVILVATICMLTEVSARSCDNLPWITVSECDVAQKLGKYSNRLILQGTLLQNVPCGTVATYQNLSSNGLFTLNFPDRCTYLQFEYSNKGKGVWGKRSLETGISQERRVYAFADNNENFFIFFFTCKGAKYEAIDTYVTSYEVIPDAEKKLKEMEVYLDRDQFWSACQSLTGYPSY